MISAMITAKVIRTILFSRLLAGVGTNAGFASFPGVHVWAQFRQVIIIFLLPMVPASKPTPPVNKAPATAFFPENPF